MLYPNDSNIYHITWGEISCTEQNGRITGYKIRIEQDDSSSMSLYERSERMLEIVASERSIVMIKIAAENTVGIGPFSEARIYNLDNGNKLIQWNLSVRRGL